MVTRLLHRFSVWLYHRFTDHDPMRLGYPGSSGAIVGELRSALNQSLPGSISYEGRLNEVPGGEIGKVVVTVEVRRA